MWCLYLACVFCISTSTGFAGGSYYSESGGGNNSLCLHSDPIFSATDEARDSRVEVHGGEYRDPPNMMLDSHVTRRSVLMIPGTNLCNEGWTTEYVGQISATRTHNDHHRTEFVCMGDDPEMTAYSSPDFDRGALFYPAQVICGSLPCIPYVEDKDLLCVVCSH